MPFYEIKNVCLNILHSNTRPKAPPQLMHVEENADSEWPDVKKQV